MCRRRTKMCHHGRYGHRRYFTKEEKAAWLQEYADELEAELKGVQERIAELKA